MHRAYLNWLAFSLTYDLNKAGRQISPVMIADSLVHAIDDIEVEDARAIIKTYQGVMERQSDLDQQIPARRLSLCQSDHRTSTSAAKGHRF